MMCFALQEARAAEGSGFCFMGKEITPFSIMPLTKHSPLLLRHIHFRHDHLSSKFDHLPSNVFDYDVFDGENVVGRIYFQDHLVAERWFWSITGSAVRDEHGAQRIGGNAF